MTSAVMKDMLIKGQSVKPHILPYNNNSQATVWNLSRYDF